ncbi:hypothetical protein L6164_013876 [Bauhinia variegata]|uniref:Uncharacterized protein n=1 Tax=Bauhinia variegata TaxID=167791 RepID=A0ACB9NGZ3_BAUVA|nr:hypothetical protein L6164_013876 [Bauhinia variegata]
MEDRDLKRKRNTKSDFARSRARTDYICLYPNDSLDGVPKQMTLLFFTTRSFSVRPFNIAIAPYHGDAQIGSGLRPLNKEGLIRRAEAWFVKIVCTAFVRSNSLDRYVSYFSKNLTPSLVIDAIRKLNNPKLGLKFFDFCRERLNFTPSFCTYNLLLRSLCQAGLHDSAKLVYDCMRSDGQVPDGWLLGFLVSSYAHAGRFDISKQFLVEIQCNKLKVNTLVYNGLFNLLVKHNKVDDAVHIFREHMGSHSHPDAFTFNILIRGLCRVQKIDDAFKFLKEMSSFGCSPDIVTYNTLIHGLCRVNEVDRARDLLKEVSLTSGFAFDTVSYTTIISGYCKLGKLEEATFVLHEMIRSGIEPNTVTFNALIDGFGKVGDMASALTMYDKMRLHGCPPDVVTFTSLIDIYCRFGLVNRGLDLWHEMNAANISPNLYTFSVLINALCKNNRLHEAREILRLLKQSKLFPEPFIYNPVVDGYCKSGNVDEANAIVAEMEEKRCRPDNVTFTILIIGHCMDGRMSEAIGIFYKMLAVGCAPDDITVNSLISCLLKAGMSGEAACIKQALLENQTLGTSLKSSCGQRTNAPSTCIIKSFVISAETCGDRLRQRMSVKNLADSILFQCFTILNMTQMYNSQ